MCRTQQCSSGTLDHHLITSAKIQHTNNISLAITPVGRRIAPEPLPKPQPAGIEAAVPTIITTSSSHSRGRHKLGQQQQRATVVPLLDEWEAYVDEKESLARFLLLVALFLFVLRCVGWSTTFL